MMEINQVVVNKLPSSCSECGWTKSLLTLNLQCAFNMMNIDCDPFEARPSWCPLVVEQERRVRCTEDGEYPEDENQIVLAEFEGKDFTDLVHIVGFDYDNAQWIDFDSDEIIPNIPEELTVYWQPLTSLKEQYKREKGGVI